MSPSFVIVMFPPGDISTRRCSTERSCPTCAAWSAASFALSPEESDREIAWREAITRR